MSHIDKKNLILGLALTGSIAIASIALGETHLMQQWGFSALLLAIVIGIVLGNSIFPRFASHCGDGVQFAKSDLLRWGIILYGFRITFQQIADVGVMGILVDALVLTTTFMLAYIVGTRWLQLDQHTSILIGAGSAICGAAAVLATEPILKAQSSKVAVAVSTVVIFGTITIFLYPSLFYLNQKIGPILSANDFGVFTGATIHEVAQVVAASKEMGDDIAATAMISKMIRVMMLAPFLVILSMWLAKSHDTHHAQRGKITIPWFALIFILVAGFNSLHLLSNSIIEILLTLDTILLAMAMAALGLHTHVSAIRQAGLKPMLLAGFLFLYLLFGGAFITMLARIILS